VREDLPRIDVIQVDEGGRVPYVPLANALFPLKFLGEHDGLPTSQNCLHIFRHAEEIKPAEAFPFQHVFHGSEKVRKEIGTLIISRIRDERRELK